MSLALIAPHLNYGVIVWGHMIKDIFKIQKKAVRTITNSKYNAHTDPLFRNMNILKLTDIHKWQLCKLYFKHVNKKLSDYFYSINMAQINSTIHQHRTRNMNKLNVLKVYHDFAKKNARYAIVNTINSLPNEVQDKVYTHSLTGFFIFC